MIATRFGCTTTACSKTGSSAPGSRCPPTASPSKHGPEILGNSYFRVFRHQGWHYALVMPGELHRSRDGLTGFEPGPVLFCPQMRHAAVRCTGDALDVFWSRVGDAPERILHSRVRLDGAWTQWRDEGCRVVLEPEHPWEGAGLGVEPSVRGEINRLVCQLRDPCVYEEDGRTHLLYCGGGESGIGIARILPRGSSEPAAPRRPVRGNAFQP